MKRSNLRLLIASCVLALSLVAGFFMSAQPAEALGPCYICGGFEGPCLGDYPKGHWGCMVTQDGCELFGGICRLYLPG